MKPFVLCLLDWLAQLHASGQAALALKALASETLKRADSPDPEQRRFDALAIAEAADADRAWDFDQAKQWLNRANLPKFVEARREDLCSYFRAQGHSAIVLPMKTETSGRNRAQWFLVVEALPTDAAEPAASDESDESDEAALVNAAPQAAPAAEPAAPAQDVLVYEYTRSPEVRMSWLGWVFLGGDGNTPTKSIRGWAWAGVLLAAGLVLLFFLFFGWVMSQVQRPLTTGDFWGAVLMLMFGALILNYWVRPLAWLVEDRIIPAPLWVPALTEDDCQLEMPKDEHHRYIRLVRYSGVCPVCAGLIELRYGMGAERRRLFGCCREAPQEHVFTFDRVTRKGRAIRTGA